MPQYLVVKPDGSWGYTSEKPKSGPIVTKEESDAYIATRGFSLNPEMGERQLAEERGLATATAPEPMPGAYAPYGLPNITGLDPNKFGATSRLPEEFQAPLNYSNLYSPADQRKVEELERDRSAISIDPTLDEDDRQTALDEVDVQKGRIPELSPMMREPTAQEKFGQRIVEVIKGPHREYFYFDDKNNPHPLETSKEMQAKEADYQKTLNKNIEVLMKLNETWGLDLSQRQIAERGIYITNFAYKRPEDWKGQRQGPATRTIRGPDIEDYYFDDKGKPVSLKELRKIYKGKRGEWDTLFNQFLEALQISNDPSKPNYLTFEQMVNAAEKLTNEKLEQEEDVPKTKVKKDVLDLTDEEINAELRKLQ